MHDSAGPVITHVGTVKPVQMSVKIDRFEPSHHFCGKMQVEATGTGISFAGMSFLQMLSLSCCVVASWGSVAAVGSRSSFC